MGCNRRIRVQSKVYRLLLLQHTPVIAIKNAYEFAYAPHEMQ